MFQSVLAATAQKWWKVPVVQLLLRRDWGCNDEKKFCYVNFSYDDNLDGKVRSIHVDTIKDHCTCAGSLSHEYGQDARFDDESCFSKAHVLCSDGNIVSMVSQSTKNPSKYSLFYSTKTPDEDLNEKSGYNQMSQDFMKVTGGKYCGTNMYKTVTYLQNDLKKSNAFDWKCQENQPETCASDYDYGSCHPKQHEGNNSTREEEPPPEKNNKVDKCNGTPSPCVGNSVATCNKISGCHFLLGYWYGGIYTPTKCWGPPTPCSNFNDDKARCVKHGCTYRKPKSSSGSSSSIFNIVGFVVAGVAGVVLIGGIVALITWHIRYRERFRKEQDREVLPMSRSDDEPSSSMSGGVAASMQSSKSTKGHSKSGGVAASKQSSFPPPKGHVYRKQYPSSTAQPWVQKEEETPIHPIGKNRSPVLSDSAKGKKGGRRQLKVVVSLYILLGFPKTCEWRMLGSTRVSQSRAIGQTWTKPETPGLTRPWWNNGHGRMTQTRSHAQHHGGSTNDSQVQVSPKGKTKNRLTILK